MAEQPPPASTRPVPYDKTPTEFYKTQYPYPDTDEPRDDESPESMTPTVDPRKVQYYAAKTKIHGTPVAIDDGKWFFHL